jgi:hypothetical protein
MATLKKIFFVKEQQKICVTHGNRPKIKFIKNNEINILISLFLINIFFGLL